MRMNIGEDTHNNTYIIISILLLVIVGIYVWYYRYYNPLKPIVAEQQSAVISEPETKESIFRRMKEQLRYVIRNEVGDSGGGGLVEQRMGNPNAGHMNPNIAMMR